MKNAQYLSHYVNACQNHTEVLLPSRMAIIKKTYNNKCYTENRLVVTLGRGGEWVKWVKVGKRYKIPHIK